MINNADLNNKKKHKYSVLVTTDGKFDILYPKTFKTSVSRIINSKILTNFLRTL